MCEIYSKSKAIPSSFEHIFCVEVWVAGIKKGKVVVSNSKALNK